jgi:asparagine synthase (glutamine-hydrolysing)
MAGEPLLDHPDHAPHTRTFDLTQLHDGFLTNKFATLRRARGVFSAASYQPASRTLTLATDKLGIRPLYFWQDERYVIFASALRILEDLREVPKVMDVRAVTETFSLEYALGDRTPFASVSLLKPGEILRVNGETLSRRQYWRWDEVQPSDKPVAELTDKAYMVFADAVALRTGQDSTTAAFLSGGLDSRAITASLVERGLYVHTFNFSLRGTQDQVFGADFARRIGTTHTEQPRELGRQVSAKIMAAAWNSSDEGSARPAERPSLVWSGDGGSVTLGHVYLTPAMVDLARAGDADAAMRLYMQRWGGAVPRRLLKRGMRDTLANLPRTGLLEEFADLQCRDAGRALHLVMMLNDQHRHLAEHFESIDLDRIEFHLPFFDSEFVATVLSVPIDECLGHRLYMQWLRRFPEAVLSVPWQAYPGHEQCPLPIPTDLAYQWEESLMGKIRDSLRRDLLRQAASVLRAPDFPHALLGRRFLRVAAWIYGLGMRDVSYVIRAAQLYYKYWSQCGGKYLTPATVSATDAKAR